jgi:Flp pilus assembly protein TadG
MIAVSERRRKQRGNQFVESAVCFLPMMAMFFGIIDVCYAVSIQSLFAAAVRAGSRWAITYQTTYDSATCTSQAVCTAQVVVDNAVGFLGTDSSYITVNYYIPNDLSTPAMSCTAGTCTASGTVPPGGFPYTYTVTTVNGNSTGTTSVTIKQANAPGNIVEVTIPGYPILWMAPIAGFSAGSTVTNSAGKTGLGLTLSASATDVLGGLAVGTTNPPAP